MFAGWADNYMNAPAHLLTGLEGPVTAIIGPWGHQYPHMAAPEPRIDFLHQMLEWWDHWLKGRDTGADRLPALRYFQQGSVRPRRHYHSQPGLWRAEQDWPSQRVTIQTLTLTSAHGLLETTPPDQTAELLNLMIATPQQCGLSAGEYFPMAIATDDHNAPGPPERRGTSAVTMRYLCVLTAAFRPGHRVAGRGNLSSAPVQCHASGTNLCPIV